MEAESIDAIETTGRLGRRAGRGLVEAVYDQWNSPQLPTYDVWIPFKLHAVPVVAEDRVIPGRFLVREPIQRSLLVLWRHSPKCLIRSSADYWNWWNCSLLAF